MLNCVVNSSNPKPTDFTWTVNDTIIKFSDMGSYILLPNGTLVISDFSEEELGGIYGCTGKNALNLSGKNIGVFDTARVPGKTILHSVFSNCETKIHFRTNNYVGKSNFT